MIHYLLCRSNTLIRTFLINIYRDRAKMKNYQSTTNQLSLPCTRTFLEASGTASIILTYKGD